MAVSKTNITTLLQEEKVQNYSYSIGFLLVFSLFVYFAIRPNLVTAFNLEKEKQTLKEQNKEYEEQILLIVEYQSAIEEYRDSFHLLDEAIPPTANITKVVDDIRSSASGAGIDLTSITVDSIEFTPDVQQYEEVYDFNITTGGKVQIAQLDAFLQGLANQRRIKSVDSLQITRTESDGDQIEAGYIINVTIKGYYL